MPRFLQTFRRVRDFAWIAALVLALSLVVFWIRGYSLGGEWEHLSVSPLHVRLYDVSWHSGTVEGLYRDTNRLLDHYDPGESHSEFRSYPIGPDDDYETDWSSWPPQLSWLKCLGFLYHRVDSPSIQSRSVGLPIWSLIVLTLIAPAVAFCGWLGRRERQLAGLCGECGYDLHGSEARCPECGTEVVGGMPAPGPLAAAIDAATLRKNFMRRLSFFVPVLLAVAALCWYGGYKEGERDANSPVRREALLRRLSPLAPTPAPVSDAEQATIESRRRAILSVDLVRLVDPNSKPSPIVGYKLRNRTDRAIRQAYGHVEFNDPAHRPLGRIAIDLDFRIEPHAAISLTQAWGLDEATRSAIANGKFEADYCIDEIYYAGGGHEHFGMPQTDGTFVGAPVIK